MQTCRISPSFTCPHVQHLTNLCSLVDVLYAQTKVQLFEILRSLEAVPGVPIETGAEVKTPATLRMPDEDEEMTDADARPTGALSKGADRALGYLFMALNDYGVSYRRGGGSPCQVTIVHFSLPVISRIGEGRNLIVECSARKHHVRKSLRPTPLAVMLSNFRQRQRYSIAHAVYQETWLVGLV